jgi:hypothetical protein
MAFKTGKKRFLPVGTVHVRTAVVPAGAAVKGERLAAGDAFAECGRAAVDEQTAFPYPVFNLAARSVSCRRQHFLHAPCHADAPLA